MNEEQSKKWSAVASAGSDFVRLRLREDIISGKIRNYFKRSTPPTEQEALSKKQANAAEILRTNKCLLKEVVAYGPTPAQVKAGKLIGDLVRARITNAELRNKSVKRATAASDYIRRQSQEDPLGDKIWNHVKRSTPSTELETLRKLIRSRLENLQGEKINPRLKAELCKRVQCSIEDLLPRTIRNLQVHLEPGNKVTVTFEAMVTRKEDAHE